MTMLTPTATPTGLMEYGMIDLTAFNNTLLNTFSEAALIAKTGGGALSISGIFERIITPNTLGIITMNEASYTLTVRKLDIDAHKIERYKSVEVRGVKYQILEINSDPVSGLAIIKLRRFRD